MRGNIKGKERLGSKSWRCVNGDGKATIGVSIHVFVIADYESHQISAHLNGLFKIVTQL